MGKGGVKNSEKSTDVFYGRPLGESVAGNDAWASKQDQQGHQRPPLHWRLHGGRLLDDDVSTAQTASYRGGLTSRG